MSFLRKQESRCLGPPKSPSPGLAFGQAGLSTARGEAGCFIRLKWYGNRNFGSDLPLDTVDRIILSVSIGTDPYQM